jgi:integrase/recombinase XerD
MRLTVMRGFVAYLYSLAPAAEVISAGELRPGMGRATPYPYSDAESRALTEAAAALRPPLWAAIYQTLFSLLVITGRRAEETIGLDKEDFDPWCELLVIRNEYGRQRLVPPHPARRGPWPAMPGSGGTPTHSGPAERSSCPPQGLGCCTAT